VRTVLVVAVVVASLLASLVLYMLGPYGHGDVALYHEDAVRFWAGSPPLRQLPAEYPVLALVPFSLTVAPPVPDYVTLFALWMLALLLAGLMAIARRESPRAAEVCAVYLALGGWGTLLGRYDLVPAAITVAAWWAARERRFSLAYVLLAAGALLKLYPALLVPVVLIEHSRALGREPLRSLPARPVLAGAGLFCGIVAAGFLVAFALDPRGWLGPFTYNAGRPLQVESLPATLLWAGSLAGFPVAPDKSFRSDNLVGQLSGVIGLAAVAALAAGLLWVWWSQATGRLGFARALTGSLLVVICTGRVLSPQYLIWVLPLVAIVDGGYDPLWLLICLLTTLVFPFVYLQLHPVGSGPPASFPLFLLGPIALRNVALVAATVRFLRASGSGDGDGADLAGRARPSPA
jgi:Glycosyltransferase family 87